VGNESNIPSAHTGFREVGHLQGAESFCKAVDGTLRCTRNSVLFMDLGGLLPRAKELTTGQYPEPD